MDYLKVLKTEESICHKLWEESYAESKDSPLLYHLHFCDFEILSFKYCKNSKKLEKEVKSRCESYLKSIGLTRDEDMCCCDGCMHDKYITADLKRDMILNVCTLAVEERVNPLEKDNK